MMSSLDHQNCARDPRSVLVVFSGRHQIGLNVTSVGELELALCVEHVGERRRELKNKKPVWFILTTLSLFALV